MGYYINKIGNSIVPARGKVKTILSLVPGSLVISTPTEFVPNLVCIVDNGPFEAAVYAYSSEEMEYFKHPDGRPRTWMIVPDAEKLAG